ncbi:hypothetical protein JG687_00012456, partial [Phytophthora cactorum]
AYVKAHPRFYLEELLTEVKARFPEQRRGLPATCLLRLLRFDLNLSRKVLERRAREAIPFDVDTYLAKLRSFYSYPEQLIFLDEASKNEMSIVERSESKLIFSARFFKPKTKALRG